MSELEQDGILQKAHEAIRKNDIQQARNLLANLVKIAPQNEGAWLALAKVVERDDQTIYCLRRALKINPDNSAAGKWLGVLEQKQLADTSLAPRGTRSLPERRTDGTTAQLSPEQASVPALWRADQSFVEDENLKKLVPRRRRNWPLILGAALFFLIAFLAIAGPALAPRDPLEENLIIQVNGKWEVPPYELFTPGFPLGSDEFGRDLLSRLLWGIRPTMVMVLIVASVRLVLGVIIGLVAGWSNGVTGRGLETMIEGALSIPVLMVALGAIAVVGVEMGIWAFIIGLSLTGWVESAQQVRDQTRIIKGQEYVQAAHALGASNRQMLVNHVLRQIMPMTVMLYAFEMSSTLMTTAGLGFLGYYIGGDVWVDVSDFVARRISGTPELGQMLATSWARLTEPWAMVVVGTTIFTAVLGFNLLGEGFRRRLDLATMRQRGIAARAREKINFWLDQNVWYPLSTFLRKPAVRTAVAGTLVLAIGIAAGSWLWPQIQPRPAGTSTEATHMAAPVPGDTSGQLVDAEASQSTLAESISAAIDWEFVDESGFSGGPALSPQNDVLYIASNGGKLYALSLDGKVIWQIQLPARSVGTPAVAGNGEIYVSDDRAGLTAVSQEGELLWHFQSDAGSRSVSGPTVGSDGRVFFTVTTGSTGFVQAVSPAGESLWAAEAKTPSFFEAPRLSPDEKLVFLKNDVFDARTGERLELESDLNVLRYFPGQDGQMYLLAGQNVIQWQLNGNSIAVLDIAEWDSSGLSEVAAASEVGVLADGTAWLLYTSPGGATNLVWVTLDDQVIGSTSYRVSRGQLIGMQDNLMAYVCGGRPFNDEYAECAALVPGGQEPVWNLPLGDHGLAQGGLRLDRKLYVATRGGMLFAIGKQKEAPITANDSTPSPKGRTSAADQTGLVWDYKFDSDIRMGPFGPDLNKELYILTEQDALYRLNMDGDLEEKFTLPTGLYQTETNSQHSYIWPMVAQDGSIFIVSEQNTVILYGPEGEILWEEPLSSDPQGYAWDRASGSLYLTDEEAGLYKFSHAGLVWKFKSAAAPYSASSPVTGPDGTVYYVVTNRGKGFVQAVSSQGKQIWATEAKTGYFYNTPQVSPDGGLVFLKDDVFEALSGNLLQLDIPFRIDEFIIGEDGHLYLRSDNNVIQWRYGEKGFEILQTASWNANQASASHVFGAYVDENSVIWLFYRDLIAWLKPDGTVIATRQSYSAVDALAYHKVKNDQVITTECIRQASAATLKCAAYTSDSRVPFWESTVDGVPKFGTNEVSWVSGDFYVASGDTLYKFYIGEPPG
jgi:ABC-type dipeptide/oligopeptide/nickel transport system permease subunit